MRLRASQKIILTILIAVFITGTLALIAYTGLFRLLETDFFSSRVKSDQRVRLENIADTILLWNQENLSRFDTLTRDRNMQSVFSISQRQEEILYRAQLSDSLEDQLLGFNGIRVVDNAGRIQYSSFAGDISSQQFGVDSRIIYRNWDETHESFELPIADENSISIIYYEEVNQQVRYQLPIQDWGFVTRGWMIVYMGLNGLTDRLARDGSIAQGANLYVVEGRGVIADIRPEQVTSVEGEIDVLWPVNGVPSEFSVLAKGLDGKYWLAGLISSDGTWVGKLIPDRLFGFSTTVRILILVTVFSTSMLLVFLLFNLRQDRLEVLRMRIKKLQINLVRDWLEHHKGRRLSLKDFEVRREEVRTELRSGLGKLKEDESAKADEIIDESWTRIAEILAEKESDATTASIGSSSTMEQAPIDMKLLEDMIARAISAVQVSAPQIQQAQEPFQAKQRGPAEEASGIAEEDAKLEDLAEVEEAAEEASGIVEEDAELEDLTEVEEAAEEASGIVEEDAELEDLTEVEEAAEEASGIVEEDVGESVGVRRLKTFEDQTMVKNDNKSYSKTDMSSEVLEVLPIVLADDFGELVEIDNVKHSRLYMFNGMPNTAHGDVIDNLESLDENDERVGDLEEIDEHDTAGKLDSKRNPSL